MYGIHFQHIVYNARIKDGVVWKNKNDPIIVRLKGVDKAGYWS